MGEYMKIGLVLEGGGTRGMYTAGVLDAFMDNNIHFDGVIGVSAGALFGVNFVSGQRGRAIKYNKKYNKDINYMGLLPLIKEGNIVSTEYAYERVPKKLEPFDNVAFKKASIPFYAVVTNVATGEAEYIEITDVFEQMDCLRASGSLPFVSKPVEIDGKLYLDGGVADSIPYKWMLENGYDKVVVILTRSSSYRKKSMPKIVNSMTRKMYPNMADAFINRHIMYNDELDMLKTVKSEKKAYVISPAYELEMSKLEKNPNKLQGGYDLGYKDCLMNLDNIIRFISE